MKNPNLDDGSKRLQDAQRSARDNNHTWAMSKGSSAMVKDAAEPDQAAIERDSIEEKRITLIRLGVDVPDQASADWIEGAYASAVGAK